MESFKICEKRIKTKAYSKEALAAVAKKDTLTIAQKEARSWINEQQDQLRVCK